MKTWFPKGKQRVIPTYGKHEGVKPVGCLDYETGRVYMEEHRKYDAEVFLQFLKNILSRYPHGKTVMILDNAKIHHAKLLKGFLKENRNRLELVFLPPYSPSLNKIEELWGWLKDSVINNVFFHSREEIQEAVQRFLSWLSTVPRMVIDRLCLWAIIYHFIYRCGTFIFWTRWLESNTVYSECSDHVCRRIEDFE